MRGFFQDGLPVNNAYYTKHKAAADRFAEDIKPITEFVNGG